MLARPIKEQLIAEMNAVREKEGFIDGRVEGFIDREKQISYTMDLFKNQADQDRESFRQEYARNLDAWINSPSSRARLVVVEGTEDNMEKVAQITFNASPLERVLIAGLDEQKQEELSRELRKLWKERLESSPANREQFNKRFTTAEDQGKSLDHLLEERSLQELMGPHIFKNDLNIDYNSMQEQFPHFDVNIEEVLCFGDSEQLVNNLGSLGENIKSGVPIFSVKAHPFEEGEYGLWKCACNDTASFMDQITTGKSAPELIGNATDDGYENITISPVYQEMFALDSLKSEMTEQNLSGLDDVEQKDLDFLKKILFDEALYPANTSPEAITKTISKATSKLGALKATKVSEALKWNMVNRPVSTAVEVEFAIGNMTLDGGNDLIKENLDIKNSYKLFYEGLLTALIDEGIEKEKAIKVAFAQTVNAYVDIEKRNETIKELVRGETGAEAWRDLGLQSTNRVKDANKLGIKFLAPLMPIFIAGAAIGVVGLGLTVVGIPAAVGLAFGIAGVAGGAIGTAATAASMYFQIKANKKHLPRANTALAEANAKMFAAQRERDTQIAGRLARVKGRIKTHEIDGLEESEFQNQKQTQPEATIGDRLTRDAKRKMLQKLQTMTDEDDIKIDGRVPEGHIDRDLQRDYTMDLFMNQANRSKISSNEEYTGDINAWMTSGSNRARMVILEAAENNLEKVAQVTFNASPLERVVVAGLDAEKEQILATELRKLWKERLEALEVNREQFNKKYKTGEDQDKSLDELLELRSLKELLGPHLYKNNLDTSFETMQREFPHFDVNVEEVLCFGNSEELVKNLGELGQKIQTGVPVFSVKASPFQEDDHGLWKCACKDTDDFMNQITQGKSAPELIGKETESGYANIDISPVFAELFHLDQMKEEMVADDASVGDEIEQKDLDFFRKILFDEALYPANTSPIAITKTISKATSKLGALAGEKVADSLRWNLVDRPVSTAVEVQFAIGSMTLDGGNDLVKEELDKKNIYKSFFEDLRDGLVKKGEVSQTEATRIAFKETVKTYVEVEKRNSTINELVNGNSGAQNWRQLGLDASNKTREVTRKGVKALRPLMPLFIVGTALGIAGLALTGVGIPLAIGLTMGVVGLSGTIASTLATGYSTVKLSKANKKYLPIANFAFAQANAKMYAAQRERVTESAKQLFEVKERLGLGLETLPQVENNTNRVRIGHISDHEITFRASETVEPPQDWNNLNYFREYAQSPLFNSEVGDYILDNLPNDLRYSVISNEEPNNIPSRMPHDELRADIKDLFIDYYLQSYSKNKRDEIKNDKRFKELKNDPDISLEKLALLAVIYAEGKNNMNDIFASVKDSSFEVMEPERIRQVLNPGNENVGMLERLRRAARRLSFGRNQQGGLLRLTEPQNEGQLSPERQNRGRSRERNLTRPRTRPERSNSEGQRWFQRRTI